MAASAEGNQRLLMYALPVVFTPFIISFPAGLVDLLDHDQRVDDGPAVGGQEGDPAATQEVEDENTPRRRLAAAAQEETAALSRPAYSRADRASARTGGRLAPAAASTERRIAQ